MKTGDYVGISQYGNKKEVTLYCRVDSVVTIQTSNTYYMTVINGCWKFKLNGTVMVMENGDVTNVAVTYTDAVPSSLNYADAIAYMNKMIKWPKFIQSAAGSYHDAVRKYRRIKYTYSATKFHMKRAWDYNSPTSHSRDNYDDDIAF